MSSHDHRFKVTNEQRRASVIYGSLGKALYIPREDMISPNNGTFEDEAGENPQGTEEESPLLSNNNQNTIPDSYDSINSNKTTVRYSRELTEQERELLKDNNLNIESDASINSTWEEAIQKGLIQTSLKFEIKSLLKSSVPMIITFLLQNSFSLASIFSVGHIGKTELAGITLGSMTANITGFAAIQGLTTCLDTLCSQAFGAGKYELVGLQFIRCSLFAITCFLPIGIIWFTKSFDILALFVPEKELCLIAANYLKIVCFGIPGFILFECGKRFLQSQNCFHGSTLVLMICAPLNMFMNWLFVWKLNYGYIGAPMAITLNYWLMPIGLLIFTKYNHGFLRCWPKNFKLIQGFQNWSKMIELALPGIIMVEVEFSAFEIVTLMASNLGTAELAAQSVISSICALAYQVPFSVSIATATRVANYIGASLITNSKVCCNASMKIGLCIGIINSMIVYFFRYNLVKIFTNDLEVQELVSQTMIVISFMEIVDCLNACSAGCLRGQGLQRIGGFINIFAFYLIGIPISFILAFKLDFNVKGLWIGIVCALTGVSILQYYFVFIGSNWEKIVEAAKARNEEEVVV